MGKPELKQVRVTPEMASAWLAATANPRLLREVQINAIATDMQRYEYVARPDEPIAISESGRLLAGNHRLTATVRSNMTVEMWVLFNVDPNLYNKYGDTGRAWSLSDMLRGEGIKVPRRTITIMRFALGEGKTPPIEPRWMVKFLKGAPGQRMAEIATKFGSYYTALRKDHEVNPNPVLAAFTTYDFIVGEKMPDHGEQMLIRMISREFQGGKKDPACKLNDELIKCSSSEGPVKSEHLYTVTDVALQKVYHGAYGRDLRDILTEILGPIVKHKR